MVPCQNWDRQNGNDKTGKTLIRPAVVGCDGVWEEVSSRISNCSPLMLAYFFSDVQITLILLGVPPLGIYNQNTEGENCEFQARHKKISHKWQVRITANLLLTVLSKTRKHWQTRVTRKHAKICSNSTCLQRCCWQYWSIFIRLAVVASEMGEIPRNSLKIQTYRVQGHPRSSILVPIESSHATCY